MNDKEILTEIFTILRDADLVEALKLLSGVQGPERHLVGDVAKRPQQGDVEEVEPGRRGVGEIGGAVELREYIDRQIVEAREGKLANRGEGDTYFGPYYYGKESALIALRQWLSDTESQRSDLSNAPILARPDSGPPSQ